ncbi:CU044_2847 family protein [Dactylosporangium sp. NPDC049525]|uniref:CU044_2847 family protein n=1 Tax=Dactylosporangium sp. NPDC049525 TaxID=3154730 RepID=UPI00341E97D1
MAGRVMPIRFGDVEVLVETSQVAGSEPTSRVGDAARAVADSYEHARTAITEIATSVAATIDQLAQSSRHPSRVEVEFGLKFSGKGSVFVAEASGEATMRILISYDVAQ